MKGEVRIVTESMARTGPPRTDRVGPACLSPTPAERKIDFDNSFGEYYELISRCEFRGDEQAYVAEFITF